jgi:hypothetical protein
MLSAAKPKLLIYGLATALAATELGILAIALTPDVDTLYRARYIDGTSQCWPLPVSGDYQLGSVLDAGKANPSPDLSNVLVCGWLDPETEGVWAFGSEARLRFVVDDVAAPLDLRLRLKPFAPNGRPAQSVPVWLNGELLTTLRLDSDEPQTEHIPISPERLPADGRLDVILTFPDARSPRSLGLGTDDRLVGAVLSQIQLVEQDTDERGSDSSGTAL